MTLPSELSVFAINLCISGDKYSERLSRIISITKAYRPHIVVYHEVSLHGLNYIKSNFKAGYIVVETLSRMPPVKKHRPTDWPMHGTIMMISREIELAKENTVYSYPFKYTTMFRRIIGATIKTPSGTPPFHIIATQLESFPDYASVRESQVANLFDAIQSEKRTSGKLNCIVIGDFQINQDDESMSPEKAHYMLTESKLKDVWKELDCVSALKNTKDIVNNSLARELKIGETARPDRILYHTPTIKVEPTTMRLIGTGEIPLSDHYGLSVVFKLGSSTKIVKTVLAGHKTSSAIGRAPHAPVPPSMAPPPPHMYVPPSFNPPIPRPPPRRIMPARPPTVLSSLEKVLGFKII